MVNFKDELKDGVYSYWDEREEYDKVCNQKKFQGLRYYSQKAMKKNYPNNEYSVIGAIGEGLKHNVGFISYKGIKYPYQSINFSEKNHKKVGYIRVGEHEYLAVLEKKKSKMILLSILLLLLVAGLLFLGFILMKDTSNLDPFAKDYAPKKELTLEGDVDNIAVPGFGRVTMEADKSVSYLALWNPSSNPCYFKYTIVLKKTGNILYESGLIPPGKAVTEQKLNQSIPEGSHEIQMKIDCFSLEDETKPLNGSIVNVTLLAIRP
ncbi:MAG: hypothetical protein RR562_07455 [Longicatena sp.]